MGWEEGDSGFDPEDERVPDCAVRKMRLCVEDVVSHDGSGGDWRQKALDEDEMVEALNGRDGIDEEEVRLRTMLMSEGALSGVNIKCWLRGCAQVSWGHMGVRYSEMRFSLIRLTGFQIGKPLSP